MSCERPRGQPPGCGGALRKRAGRRRRRSCAARTVRAGRAGLRDHPAAVALFESVLAGGAPGRAPPGSCAGCGQPPGCGGALRERAGRQRPGSWAGRVQRPGSWVVGRPGRAPAAPGSVALGEAHERGSMGLALDGPSSCTSGRQSSGTRRRSSASAWRTPTVRSDWRWRVSAEPLVIMAPTFIITYITSCCAIAAAAAARLFAAPGRARSRRARASRAPGSRPAALALRARRGRAPGSQVERPGCACRRPGPFAHLPSLTCLLTISIVRLVPNTYRY